MALQTGDMVGPYRIVNQFGQGGMATVYKAYHPQLERNVAIKFLQQSYVDDVNFLARFEREAKIIASLDHPNIVPIYDFNYFNGQPYLVMKSIEGVTLKEIMTDDAITKSQVLDMLTAVAAGLTYAHERQILHRDIKPSNILVDANNRPYITDFGLARMTQPSQSTLSQDMLLRTPHYMSPEQAKGADDLTPATDIYSLGVILYEFAVGRVPFSSNTPYAIVHDHIYTPLPSPRELNPSVNPEVEAVLTRALAKSPTDRFASAVEMLTSFKQAFTLPVPITAERTKQVSNAHSNPDAPLPSFTVGVPAAVSSTAAPDHSNSKNWLWIGAAVLLLALVAIGVVAMNASPNPASETPLPTLASLNVTNAPVSAHASPIAIETTVVPTAEYLIPNVTIAEAQATLTSSPGDASAYLAIAKASWLKNDDDNAMTAIQTGYRIATDKISFLLTGASLANSTNHVTISLFLDSQALFLAQLDSSRYQSVRAEVGEIIYKVAQTPNDINMRELEHRNQSIPDFQQPDLFDIMAVQILVAQNRLPLAQAAYNRLSTPTRQLPEAYLVHGELLQAQGNTEKAKKEWKVVLQIADTPQWVTVRVTELLKSN